MHFLSFVFYSGILVLAVSTSCAPKKRANVKVNCKTNERILKGKCVEKDHSEGKLTANDCIIKGKDFDSFNNRCLDKPLEGLDAAAEKRKSEEEEAAERKRLIGSNDHYVEAQLSFLNPSADGTQTSEIVAWVKLLDSYEHPLTVEGLEYTYHASEESSAKLSLGKENAKSSLVYKFSIKYKYGGKTYESAIDSTGVAGPYELNMEHFMTPKKFAVICTENCAQ